MAIFISNISKKLLLHANFLLCTKTKINKFIQNKVLFLLKFFKVRQKNFFFSFSKNLEKNTAERQFFITYLLIMSAETNPKYPIKYRIFSNNRYCLWRAVKLFSVIMLNFDTLILYQGILRLQPIILSGQDSDRSTESRLLIPA